VVIVFRPLDIFRVLYREDCVRACRTGILAHHGSRLMLLPSKFIELLEKEISGQYTQLRRRSESSGAWHREIMSRFEPDRFTFRSPDTCSICVMERPQCCLPCGHFTCGSCIRRFGDVIEAWRVGLDHCILCRSSTSGLSVAVSPSTATPRLLSVDGGGARGVIPLVFLQCLEERIGLPLPVQDNFDFVFGTSSGESCCQRESFAELTFPTGGIIALALCINGWKVSDCVEHFERLAKLAFLAHSTSYIRWAVRLLMSLITDGIYPAQVLETVLQEVFGNRRILDPSHATAVGTKIGITVSSMKPEPFIFTNYNGVGDRRNKKYEKYGVLLGNIPVWEM
jgi:hypothetical protein